MAKSFYVDTPAGLLYVHEAGSKDNYPGVYVEKVAGEGKTFGELLTVVEYDQTIGSFQTCVYDGGSDEPTFIHHHTGLRGCIPDEAFKCDLRAVLSSGVISDDCVGELLNSDKFYRAVKADVEQTSGWYDEGAYNHDDIRLAIGRVLCSAFERGE